MSGTVTPAMLKEAQAHGWTVTEAARHFGVHNETFRAYAARRGVELPKGKPGRESYSGPNEEAVSRADDTRVKAWSCRPSAIAKALAAAQASRAAFAASVLGGKRMAGIDGGDA